MVRDIVGGGATARALLSSAGAREIVGAALVVDCSWYAGATSCDEFIAVSLTGRMVAAVSGDCDVLSNEVRKVFDIPRCCWWNVLVV